MMSMTSITDTENPSEPPRLILASASPRRRQILESMGLAFTVAEPKADEVEPTIQTLTATIEENAYQKALAVVRTVQRSSDIVVAADTLVAIDDVVVGKPKGMAEARSMLQRFSGRTQTVVTGLVLFSHYYGVRRSHANTQITFHDLESMQIEEYLKTREPYDKAGAYAVQGLGALFIRSIEGSYSNAMGFPLELFLKELHALTQLPLYRWFQ